MPKPKNQAKWPVITIDGRPIKGILEKDTYRCMRSPMFEGNVLVELQILVDPSTFKSLFSQLIEHGDVNVHYECKNPDRRFIAEDDDEDDE